MIVFECALALGDAGAGINDNECDLVSEYRLTRYELPLTDVLWTIEWSTVQHVGIRLERELARTTGMLTLKPLVTKKQVLTLEQPERADINRPAATCEELSKSILANLKRVRFSNQRPSLGREPDGRFPQQKHAIVRS
jgi:predicted transcriptional regulator